MKNEYYFFLLSAVYLAPTMPKPICKALGVIAAGAGAFLAFKG